MSPARVDRLIALALVVGGALGLLATARGLFASAPFESTAVFPLALLGGLALLHARRPSRSSREATPERNPA